MKTAAKRVRSVSARYSAQRTGLSFGSGRSRCCARPARMRVVGRRVDAADIVGDARGAIGEGGVAQIADQAGDVVLGQAAGVHLAGDRERHQQDRVAERVLVGTGAEAGGQVQEFLGQGGGFRQLGHPAWQECDRFVRCSKGNCGRRGRFIGRNFARRCRNGLARVIG